LFFYIIFIKKISTEIWYPIAMVNYTNKGWSDTNNNHIVDEWEFYTILPKQTYSASWTNFDRNTLTLYGPVESFALSSIDENGIPTWNVCHLFLIGLV
jgi:hypothetical protein